MCDINSTSLAQNIDILLGLQSAVIRNDIQCLESLRILRNLCARGATYQEHIATHKELNDFLHLLLSDNGNARCQEMVGQLLGNALVNNPISQREIWSRHGELILQKCTLSPIGRITNIMLMIIFNVLNGSTGALAEKDVLRIVIQVWRTMIAEKYDENIEFLHFIFEHFLVKNGRSTVRFYAQLESDDRNAFLNYLTRYLQDDSPNGTVHSFLLQHLSKDFKVQSDRVLCYTAERQMQPHQACALLRVIASATGWDRYSAVYAVDHALFLNISSVLRCLVIAGKESTPNMYTPMNKLEEVALTSNITRDFESEMSFELKTLLVRCIANLLYENKVNQGYCVDTQLMATLFECTNMDARNPLIKEWSIVAIRNACKGCPEIQEIVANLTNQGVAKNDILSELDLQMGSLRIQHKID